MKTFFTKGGVSAPGFWELEEKCQAAFESGGPFWHVCTNGNEQEIIFTSVMDFIAGMNAVSVALNCCSVNLIAFILMNNHVHFIMEGPKENCLDFFKCFKKKLNVYLSRTGRANVLKNFDCGEPIRIETLDQLRTEICYVHRNMYVARNDILPHTWAWGSGCLYFNPVYVGKQTTKLSDIPYQERRMNYFFGRDIEMPECYVCANGYIQPECFVSHKRGEAFFRHASHYFNSLVKDREAYSLVAKRLGDSDVLNYEEVYSVAVALSHENWKNSKPQTLPMESKLEVARVLHYDYRISNYEISRVLKLDPSMLSEYYPERH